MSLIGASAPAAEPPLPEGVAQDDRRWTSGLAVARREPPTENRTDPEQREI